MNQDLTALTTYLCKRYQVPMPFVKFVDDSHWVEGGCEGYYILRIHLITLCKGTRIPELALCHEFGHFLADITNRVEKSAEAHAQIHAQAEKNLQEFRAAN